MAQASFPQNVKTWTDKQDFVDDVVAKDTNEAYAEIIAIETELLSNMPYRFKDITNNKTYRYGLQIQNGVTQIIYEEVI